MALCKICVYIPQTHAEQVKFAMFEAGAGRIGPNDEYDHCAWQTVGQGQFRPLSGSNPAIGQQQQDTVVDELKVEMVCDQTLLPAVVAALKGAHPYEQPAYQAWPLLTV